jgi:hypothetical protein
VVKARESRSRAGFFNCELSFVQARLLCKWAFFILLIIMAKTRGSICPNCGEMKFHKANGVQICSNCDASGWSGENPPGKIGRGSACKVCGNNTYRVLAQKDGLKLSHCSNCKSTVIHKA